ncbi:hypothetical protein [Caldanaerovirga acetigignens]|uniref:hypothetical protein n=1 Tax=Caldanaerovirga acetigignens TaxID=447595 RepID=UPI001356570F|nr:hypothetical protein [Caldanaerovirga acetigignens]
MNRYLLKQRRQGKSKAGYGSIGFIFGGLGFPRLKVVGAGISSFISRLAEAIWLI